MTNNQTDHHVDGISWQPLWTVKINFDSRKAKLQNNHHLEFKATKTANYFGWAFIFVGMAISALIFILIDDAPWINLFGLIFVAIGLFFLYLANRKISFDHVNGIYQKGTNTPLLLLHIKGLQLLSDYVSNKNGNYINYQLNLVLSDNKRQNIVIYVNRPNAIDDAKKLADFLGVTLWSDIEFGEYIP